MACVGTFEQFFNEDNLENGFLKEMETRRNSHNIHNVDYYGKHEKLIRQGFKNAGEYSYVISNLDSLDKFSKSFRDCTGIIVAGQDQKTGKNISFLSHQDPQYFLSKETNKNEFIKDLKEQLINLKENSVDGTIDAVIVGGNYFKGRDKKEFRQNYLNSIELLAGWVKEILGFEPVVITGPKTGEGGYENIFYNNNGRHLYIIRPKVGDSSTEGFLLKDIKKQEKKW